jgi:lauroyl/myristoyl acyltransferase
MRLGERLARGLTGGRSRRLASLHDAATVMTFLAAFLLAFATPRPAWPAMARWLGTLHVRLSPPRLADTVATLTRHGVAVTEHGLAVDLSTYTYLDTIEAISDYLPFRRRGTSELVGLEHVRAAQALGRGVIIWKTQARCSGISAIRGYPGAGLAVIALRSFAHPLSDTALGLILLNRIRTNVEDRNLGGIIMLEPDGGRSARQQMEAVLQRNEIISLAPVGTGHNPIVVPFMGGTLRVGRGAPSLALKTGAPIVPMTTTAKPGPVYIAEFDPPIWVDPPAEGRPALVNHVAAADPYQAIAEVYASGLAEKLRHDPGRWRSWLMSHTWIPAK